MNYRRFRGETTEDFKQRIATDLEVKGLERKDIAKIAEGIFESTVALNLDIMVKL